MAARCRLICKVKLHVRGPPIRYNDSKSFKLIVGNGKMDVDLKMISMDSTLTEDILILLGSNDKRRLLPLLFSVEVHFSNYNFGNQDKNRVINTMINKLVANCPRIHRIAVAFHGPPYGGSVVRNNQVSYSFRSVLYDSVNKESYVVNPKCYESLLASSFTTLKRLTRATLNIDNLSQQIPDPIRNSSWNLQFIDIKYKYCFTGDETSKRIQLDLSGIRHLKYVKFDITALD